MFRCDVSFQFFSPWPPELCTTCTLSHCLILSLKRETDLDGQAHCHSPRCVLNRSWAASALCLGLNGCLFRLSRRLLCPACHINRSWRRGVSYCLVCTRDVIRGCCPSNASIQRSRLQWLGAVSCASPEPNNCVILRFAAGSRYHSNCPPYPAPPPRNPLRRRQIGLSSPSHADARSKARARQPSTATLTLRGCCPASLPSAAGVHGEVA